MELYINSKKHGVITAVIDDDDFELVNSFTWSVIRDKGTKNLYVMGHDKAINRYKTIQMHRIITNCPVDKVVDHINHNTLDNRKSNLRICERSDNCKNYMKPDKREYTSKYKGVSLKSKKHKFVAQISVNNKKIHIGYYDTEDKAAIAYNIAALKHHGEFAFLNNVMSF